MCSSIRNTTRKKTVKLTLNMGIPILFYSKDKHQNKEANTFSLQEDGHTEVQEQKWLAKDNFNLSPQHPIKFTGWDCQKLSVSMKMKQE